MSIQDKKLELLAPAGDMARLHMALTYGADAVYLAGNMFGMRAASGNFNRDEMKEAVRLCHEKGVKVYITCNTLPRNNEVKVLPEYLEFLESIGVDAIIVADVGVFMLAKKYAPNVDLHVSTQTGITNYESAKAFYDLGAKRIIPARELSVKDLIELRNNTPADLEIEAFVHGAMCMSFSGRCLLSNYLTGRDANRGACAQPCRWKYYVSEEKRPGEFFEISEDGGTYIFNSRDMCMIDHLPDLIEAGVISFKIEGRMKSEYYVGCVTNAYRHVIDSIIAGEEPNKLWYDEIYKVSHREYSTGFFYGNPGQHTNDSVYIRDWDVVGVVDSCDDEGNAVVYQRNKFYVGEELNLMTPDHEPIDFICGQMKDKDGNSIESTPHANMMILMKLPFKAPKYSAIRMKTRI